MVRTAALLTLGLLTLGYTAVPVAAAPPAAEVSGRWVGVWRGVAMLNMPREDAVQLDLVQDGERGRGRMVWSGTGTADVPRSIRLGGAGGVPVVFVVSGTTVVVRHEMSAKEFTVNLVVDADDMAGQLVGKDDSKAELKLVRQARVGTATTRERLGQLELDVDRERRRTDALAARAEELSVRVAALDEAATRATALAEDASDAAQKAIAASGESDVKTEAMTTEVATKLAALNRRIDDNGNGQHNGTRALVHSIDVRFRFNRAELDDAAATALLEVVGLLKENPELGAELEGFADIMGAKSYNVRLSEHRVQNVHRYLAQRGVPLERIHVVGYGSLPGKAADARAKNRRVTIKLLTD
jgi:outer membrane protein OmpA-like peptidoglycan-associated protein